jgi:hypothetical protein
MNRLASPWPDRPSSLQTPAPKLVINFDFLSAEVFYYSALLENPGYRSAKLKPENLCH